MANNLNKKLTILLGVCSLVSTLYGCDLFNASAQQPLWSVPISDGKLISSTLQKQVHESGVICIGTRQRKNVLYKLEESGGKTLWAWDDFFDPAKTIDGYITYRYQHHFIVNDAYRTYNIDARTGKTQWKTYNDRIGRNILTGIGNYYYVATSDGRMFQGNALTGEETLLFGIDSVPAGARGIMNHPLPFIAENGDTMLTATYGYTKNRDYTIYLGLYNVTKKQLVYKVLQRDGSETDGKTFKFSTFWLPIHYNNKLYFAIGESIQCNDVSTGRMMWKRDFNDIFLFSGIVLAGNQIIGNCEDRNMYALNAETGEINWKTQTSGTSSHLFVMNDVVYFTGGGDGLFHAIDIKTGKHIWKLECLDTRQNPDSWFADGVTGGNGKVYVSSYLSLYCYKAAQ